MSIHKYLKVDETSQRQKMVDKWAGMWYDEWSILGRYSVILTMENWRLEILSMNKTYEGFMLVCDYDGFITNTKMTTPAAWDLAAQALGLETSFDAMVQGTLGKSLTQKRKFIEKTYKKEIEANQVTWDDFYAKRTEMEGLIFDDLIRRGEFFIPRAIENLQILHGSGMILTAVTSSPRARAMMIKEKIETAAGIDNMFEMVSASEDTREHKPKPVPVDRIILDFAKKRKIKPWRVLGLGGDLPIDVIAGEESLAGRGFLLDENMETCGERRVFKNWDDLGLYIVQLANDIKDQDKRVTRNFMEAQKAAAKNGNIRTHAMRNPYAHLAKGEFS